MADLKTTATHWRCHTHVRLLPRPSGSTCAWRQLIDCRTSCLSVLLNGRFVTSAEWERSNQTNPNWENVYIFFAVFPPRQSALEGRLLRIWTLCETRRDQVSYRFVGDRCCCLSWLYDVNSWLKGHVLYQKPLFFSFFFFLCAVTTPILLDFTHEAKYEKRKRFTPKTCVCVSVSSHVYGITPNKEVIYVLNFAHSRCCIWLQLIAGDEIKKRN